MNLYLHYSCPFLPLITLLTGFTFSSFSYADTIQQQSIRIQQQQNQLERQLAQSTDIHLSTPEQSTEHFNLSTPEQPCIQVKALSLKNPISELSSLIPELTRQTGFKSGMCLGANGIQYLQNLAQNIVIDKGLITTQIVIEPQDLNSGMLFLTAVPGYMGKIKFNETGKKLTALGKYFSFSTKLGDLLDLTALEQGLENLRRLSGVNATIQIEPSENTEGASDIIVDRQQEKWASIGIGFNNQGSKTTGKYQGNANLMLINPLGMNDLLYVTYNKDLGHHKITYVDQFGKKTKSGSKGYSLHYSVPFGKWLWTLNHSYYRYHEAIEGAYVNYDYSGKTYNTNLSLSREIFRSRNHKAMASVKLWRLRIYKYIDDAEIEVQRRQMGGWEIGIEHKAQLGRVKLEGGLSYKRGTGIFHSIAAPEEFNNEHDAIPGTARMKLINAQFMLTAPFQLANQMFSFDSSIFAQWNKTPLVPQDKLSIGNQYTVRGFDGEQNLSGERGWYWRNNLNWHYADYHQLYLGFDVGRVSGLSTRGLPHQQLVGAAIGIKGSALLGGQLDYDLFVAKPLSKPDYFKTESTTFGLAFNYRY